MVEIYSLSRFVTALTYPAFICAEALSVISLDSGDV